MHPFHFVLILQMHKIVFTSVTLPRQAVLRYFLSIFVYRYFFMYFYISWEPFSLVTLFLLGITKELNALNKLFYNISPLLGAILRYFKNYFGGMFLYSWELLYILSDEILYYPDSQYAKKNFTACTSLLGALHAVFLGLF